MTSSIPFQNGIPKAIDKSDHTLLLIIRTRRVTRSHYPSDPEILCNRGGHQVWKKTTIAMAIIEIH